MADMLRMIMVLSLLCGLSGFALSYLKTVTMPRIEEQVLVYVQGPALARVLGGAENSLIADRRKFLLPDGGSVTVFPALRDGKLTSVALEDSGKGYGGPIGVMVGFNIADDTLTGIGITTLKETPGLGMRITEPAFTGQFVATTLPVALKSQNGAVDAVSGATISSNGAMNAVNRAASIYAGLKPEILKAWAGQGSAQGDHP